MPLPLSRKFPAKVYFFAAKPAELIAAGYDSLRIEKSEGDSGIFEEVRALPLDDETRDYVYVDDQAMSGDTYRAVLQNSADPGNPVDVVQPKVKGVPTAFEAICTVRELREIHLWGNDQIFTAGDGRQFPEYAYVHAIHVGIRNFERNVSIRVLPKPFVEHHDYERVTGRGKGVYTFFVLDEFPVREIERVTLTLPGGSPIEIPESWVKIRNKEGQVVLVPDSSLVGPGVGLFSVARDWIPDAWEIEYIAGFDPADFSTEYADVKEAIMKEAAMLPLNVGGDLVAGAGVAGSTISMDGLSQSIQTTSSATNAGFGARLIQYEKELKRLYKVLVPYFKGLRMSVG